MKKVFFALICFSMFLLTSCGSGSNNNANKENVQPETTPVVTTPEPEDNYQKIVADAKKVAELLKKIEDLEILWEEEYDDDKADKIENQIIKLEDELDDLETFIENKYNDADYLTYEEEYEKQCKKLGVEIY